MWRDKNVDVLIENKLVKSNRSTHSILDKDKPFSAHIPILPNGGTTKGNKKQPTIISSNTCPFDCLYQIFAAFYKDFSQIQKRFNESDREFDKFIVESFQKKEMTELVDHRNKLFCTLFAEKVFHGEKNMKSIDVFMTVNEMLNVIAMSSDVVYSVKTKKSPCLCRLITKQSTSTCIRMNFKGDWQKIIGNLQSCIGQSQNHDYCYQCFTKIDVEFEYNNIAVIHIELAYPNDQIYKIELNKISKNIILNDNIYEFRAAVQYTPGHFIAHLFRKNGKFETYDDLKHAKVQRTPKSFYSVFYFYVNTSIN